MSRSTTANFPYSLRGHSYYEKPAVQLGKKLGLLVDSDMTSAKQQKLGRLKPLAVLLVAGSCLATVNQLANAQIIPDDTLGVEQSRLASQGAKARIEGGAIRGTSLFHSFSEFNINAEQQVYFANPATITNILTRVTGRNPSNILGTLGVEGQANLFLLNPHGILFGPNARLDVAGSFTATTADSIRLDRYEFSATNPQAPPLLTINVTPGLQYGNNTPIRVIENQGRLAVGTGQRLALLGGTVRQSGSLVAPAGSVELSGARVELSGTVDTRAANGTVGTFLLDPKDILIQAGTPTSGATISAALANSNVVLQANNDITVDDDIASASGNNLTFLAGRSLSILPNHSITLNGGSLTAKINDETASIAERDAGIAQFVMAVGSQILTNGGYLNISSGTFGQTSQINTTNGIISTASPTGNGGNLTMTALGDVTTGLLDTRSSTSRGGNLSLVSTGGTITTTQTLATDSTAQAGNIFLTAVGDINVTHNITANSLGQAGNLSLIAGGNLNLTSNGFVRGDPIFGTTGNFASVGAPSGTITLTSGGTIFGQDVRVANIVTGSSPGGNIIVNAGSIQLERSSILALTNSSGRSGDLLVNVAEDVILQDSNIATNANNGTRGDAGDLTLNTQRLSISRTPGIVLPFTGVGVGTTTDPASRGNSGNLIVNASESVELVGDLPGAYVINPTQVVADLSRTERTSISTSATGSGNAGNLTLQTGLLVTRDGAGIFTVPLVGRGGDLTVNATEILLQGAGGISTGTVGPQRAGNLAIAAAHITLTDGALINTATAGIGDAGDLTLSVRQLSILNGSAISTVTLGRGNGGATTINNADLIEVAGTSPGGEFSSSIRGDSWGTGNAGSLDITASHLSILQGGELSTVSAGSGVGGNIKIKTDTLQLNNGRINASTLTAQRGGDITIQAAESVNITGAGADALFENIINPAFQGTLGPDNFIQGITTVTVGQGAAGNVLIETPNFTAQNGALMATTTLAQGKGGNITIRAGNTIDLDSSLLATGTFTAAPSGDINLSAQQLIARGGAQAITTTFGSGRAGNLTVNASDSINLSDPSKSGLASGLLASSFQTAAGTGGDIRITTQDFNIRDGATVSVSGAGTGNAGNIEVDARSVFLDRGSITATSASGEGGNITLRSADLLLLRHNSTISTTAGQTGTGGNGGNINIQAGFVVAVPRENSDITANAFEGRGGNITIATQGLFGTQVRDRLTPLSDITASSEVGLNGTVTIDVLDPNPASGLVELPTTPINPEGQIVARCTAPTTHANSFVVTGRGGLPQDPRQFLPGQSVVQDLRSSAEDAIAQTPQIQQSARATPRYATKTQHSSPIVEAQAWQINPQGNVELVAKLPQPQQPISDSNCQTLKPGERR